MINIGNEISNLRKEKGISQGELASYLNVSRQAVSNWERNKTQPDIGILEQIADYFDISVDDLFKGKTSISTKNVNTVFFTLNIILFIIHLIFCIMGTVRFASFFVVPCLMMFISTIMHLVFKNSYKTGDYSIIAGYDKQKDDDRKVKKQLKHIELINQIITLLCNIVFFGTYNLQDNMIMPISFVILLIYISGLITVPLIVTKKIKSR